MLLHVCSVHHQCLAQFTPTPRWPEQEATLSFSLKDKDLPKLHALWMIIRSHFLKSSLSVLETGKSLKILVAASSGPGEGTPGWHYLDILTGWRQRENHSMFTEQAEQ